MHNVDLKSSEFIYTDTRTNINFETNESDSIIWPGCLSQSPEHPAGTWDKTKSELRHLLNMVVLIGVVTIGSMNHGRGRGDVHTLLLLRCSCATRWCPAQPTWQATKLWWQVNCMMAKWMDRSRQTHTPTAFIHQYAPACTNMQQYAPIHWIEKILEFSMHQWDSMGSSMTGYNEVSFGQIFSVTTVETCRRYAWKRFGCRSGS